MMINWTRVEELRDEIGADDFSEIVEIFLEEVEGEIEKLRGDHDAAQLEAQLHFLKGSALNLGFSKFSELCQSGETAAASGVTDAIELPRILSTYEQSKAEFLSRFPELPRP